MKKISFALYNLILALWVGGIFIYTFLITPIIFTSFSRDAASAIVDKLFPFYFPYDLILSCLAFAFFLLSGFQKGTARNKIAMAMIVIAIVINAYVNFRLFPEIKKVKQQIVSFENTPPDSPARKQFGKMHGVSAILNLVLLAEGTALIVIGPSLKRPGHLPGE